MTAHTIPSPAPPWIQTLSAPGRFGGGKLDLLNPRPEQINFYTMSQVLSRVPRFGGHTERGVYSVAQHCREGAYAVLRDTGRRDYAAAFLLHDAHEYVMGDIATPVAQSLAAHAVMVSGDLGSGDVVRAAIRSQKAVLDAAIYPAAGILWPLRPDVVLTVKEYDLRVGRTEKDARLAPSPGDWAPEWENAVPVRGMDTSPRHPEIAARMFYAACEDLLPGMVR